MSSLKSHFNAANVILYAYVLFVDTALVLYEFSGADSRRFDPLTRIALIYALGYWLLSDSRRRRYELPYCAGVILLGTGALYLPYYLFRTRGVMAFATISIFLAAHFASGLFGAALAAALFGTKVG
jgi:hypothetical protein